jgi:hypothetical protein
MSLVACLYIQSYYVMLSKCKQIELRSIDEKIELYYLKGNNLPQFDLCCIPMSVNQEDGVEKISIRIKGLT